MEFIWQLRVGIFLSNNFIKGKVSNSFFAGDFGKMRSLNKLDASFSSQKLN